jgi:hypothetical protein
LISAAFGEGMYCRGATAGADQALVGITALGNTQEALVHPEAKFFPAETAYPTLCKSKLAR